MIIHLYNLTTYIKLEYFRVSTCSKASVSNFLRAHEDVGKILFNQITEESTPVLNIVNRYSGKKIFGILHTRNRQCKLLIYKLK